MTVEKDWTTVAGLRAVAVWNDMGGFRCGYVQVPADHPLHGVEYSDESEALGTMADLENEQVGNRGVMSLLAAVGKDSGSLISPDLYFDVHGSLTYSSDHCPLLDKEPGEWWFGFDCGHSGDATGLIAAPGDVQRSLSFVEQQCESLAQQLADLARIVPEQ